jgi:mannosylglycerate hydrolase MGH1-like protein
MAPAERRRLAENSPALLPHWRRWGCYVSERAWATVREDYSENGDAWNYLSHEHARSKAYRWGEDGIGGLCDRYQILLLSAAFWNGRDPILKERLFGLTSSDGNHGEDVKEYYFYLDATPTGSYMKLLYKYPQVEFPYERLIRENRQRTRREAEFELLDTGAFADDRYFDIVIEYAKQDPDDICIRVEAFNRGPDQADLHFLPHLWFRNTWGWSRPRTPRPRISRGSSGAEWLALTADDSSALPLPNLTFEYRLGPRHLYVPPGGAMLFTDNETNAPVVYGDGHASASHFTKDAFHRHIIHGEPCINPDQIGTKACVHYKTRIQPGASMVWRLRLTPAALTMPLDGLDAIVQKRRHEADEFYASIHPPNATDDEKLVQRQAFAGLLWSRQIYLFDVNLWLDGDDPYDPPPPSRKRLRNAGWRHLNSMRILSMPDKWEYPWVAAWDLAFHCVTLALVDPVSAKDNLLVLLREQFQHPNGQLPACEWEFSELNPPVHAWACWRVYELEKARFGVADAAFLERSFHKLLLNFAWWVNKVDSQGLNVFEGGFLGLDNIAVLDRSEKLESGVVLEQSDATGWMGFFCLHMMRIALELAVRNPVYEAMATKFFEHFIYIAGAMKNMGGRDHQLWDEADGFFYDVLRYPDGSVHKFAVRSLVGLIPLFAIDVLEDSTTRNLPTFSNDIRWFIRNRTDLVGQACYTEKRDGSSRDVLSIVDRHQLARVLQRLWDEAEFLSPGGIRSLSKFHDTHPFEFGDGTVRYEPADAELTIKGGNSNWRGPVWFPTSYLLIRSLLMFSRAFGPEYKVPLPRAGGAAMRPADMARDIANRMIAIFTRDDEGRRPVFGGMTRFQQDPHWRDCLLFNEYFHGDNRTGLGASHQTGWTALVANLIDEWRR